LFGQLFVGLPFCIPIFTGRKPACHYTAAGELPINTISRLRQNLGRLDQAVKPDIAVAQKRVVMWNAPSIFSPDKSISPAAPNKTKTLYFLSVALLESM